MDTSTRVTEPCSFHHLQKKLGIVLLESDGTSVPGSVDLVVFTTIERGLWQFLETLRIPFPESLNRAVFTTYRKRGLIT
jgi:hypothetical protein